MARPGAAVAAQSCGDVVVVGRRALDKEELVTALTAQGVQAERVETAEAVAKAIVTSRPDAVVVDLRDDDRIASGIVHWLYRHGGGNALAITELADMEMRLRVLQLGLIDHLIAPFDTREAVARVVHLMDRRR